MNKHFESIGSNSQRLFSLRFKRQMRELLAQGHSAAETFGIVWEKTLDAFPVEDSDQAPVYWELIEWVGRPDLFTAQGVRQMLKCGRETVHEL